MAQDFISAIFGAPPDYSNALTPQQTQQMRTNALTQGGIGALVALLGASGPQTRPIGTGQALAGALGAGFGGYQSSFDNTLKQMLTAGQLSELQVKTSQRKQLADAMAIADPQERIKKLQEIGSFDVVKNMAESQSALRKSGLMAQPGVEPVSPFAAYESSQSPQVRSLAQQLSQGFKTGVIDEETAYKRLEPLARMEDSFVARQISQAERADARASAAADRDLKRAEGRKPTEAEQKAAGFSQRMELSNQLITDLENKIIAQGQEPNVMFPTATSQAVGSIPLIGNFARTKITSTEQQQYRQAQENWVRANLRKESGAVIGAEEMDAEIRTYFPQPGESTETIAQKNIARQVTQEAMKTAAGTSYKPFDMRQFKKDRGLE
jgi:hypothetical protein